MKRFKKIAILTIAIISIIFNIKEVNASDEEVSFYEGEWIPNIYITKALPSGYKRYQQGQILRRKSDNQFVYCLEPFAPFSKSAIYQEFQDNYANNLYLSNKVWRKVNLLSYYGYMYEGHEDAKWYAITQVLIWKTVNPDYDFYFTEKLNGSKKADAYQNEINELESLIANHEKEISFIKGEININANSNTTLNDTNMVLENYEVLDSTIPASINGNSLTFKTLSPGKESITLIRKDKKNLANPLIYKHSDYQNILATGTFSPTTITLNINVNGIALKVTKIDYDTKKPLKIANLKFKIKDLSTNEYLENPDSKEDKYIFLTNENGYFITSPTLNYGKYAIIEEDNELEGYIWNQEPLQVNLTKENVKMADNNLLTYEAKFYNKRIKGKIIALKLGENLNTSNNNFNYYFKTLENVTIALYVKNEIKDINGNVIYSKDAEINRGITDKEGKIVFDDLYLGSYYLKEIKNDDIYKLDDTKYNIDLTSENQEETVIKNITIKNYLKKGSVTITKVNSLTNEPLSNVKIGLFNSNDVLVYEALTDVNGKITLENLALGTYYIKELEPPAGFALKNDIINFSITSDNEAIYIDIPNDPIISIPDTYSPKKWDIELLFLLESIILVTWIIKRTKNLKS